MEATKKIIKFALLIVVIAVIAFIYSPIKDAINNQVTVYPVTKDNYGNEFPLNRSIYRVSTGNQTVIFWIPGFQEIPMSLKNCTVRDRFHWQCKDGARMSIMDGSYFEITSQPDIKYVGRLEWWLIKEPKFA